MSFNPDLKKLIADTAFKMYVETARDLRPIEGNVVHNYYSEPSVDSLVEWSEEKKHYNLKRVQAVETHTEQLTKRLKASLL